MSDPKRDDLSVCSEEELAVEMARLTSEMARRRAARTPMDMSAMEAATEAVKKDLGNMTLAELLRTGAPEDNHPKPCPKCRKPVAVRARGRPREIRTLSGTHTLLRNYHWCGECRLGFHPRDLELGLPAEGDVTYELEKRILDFAVNDAFEHAAARWSVHYPEPISENLLRRVTERVGDACTGADPSQLQVALQPPAAEPTQLLSVFGDGSMLPTRGPEPWREAKVGVVFRDENHVSYRDAPRGQVSQARYVAVVGNPEEFAKEMTALLEVEQADMALRVAWVADGAPWIWNVAHEICPKASQILDVRHAEEKGMTCGKALLGDNSPLLPLWQTRMEQLLLTSNVNATVSELMECAATAGPKGRKAVNDLIRYYRTNENRMAYRRFLDEGLPIGSGCGESAHRHVLQTRMKKSGQHWDPMRADHMARLRAAYRTAGPARFHWAIRRSGSPTPLRASST
jgi:hypothetical protein